MVLPFSYIYKVITGNVHSYAMRNLKCSFGLPGFNRSGCSSHSAPFEAVQDQISIFRFMHSSSRPKNHSPRYRVFSASLGIFKSYVTRRRENVCNFRILDIKHSTFWISLQRSGSLWQNKVCTTYQIEIEENFHWMIRVWHLLRAIRTLKLESAIYKIYPRLWAILFIFSVWNRSHQNRSMRRKHSLERNWKMKLNNSLYDQGFNPTSQKPFCFAIKDRNINWNHTSLRARGSIE